MLLLVVCVGCGSLAYPRVSGEAYYRALAGHGPVVEFQETRPVEGTGTCFHVLTLKGQMRGFVTHDDMLSTAQKNPAFVARATAFQQAFAVGVAAGIAESASGSPCESLSGEAKPPVYLAGSEEFWKWGMRRGFAYGKQLPLGRFVPITPTDPVRGPNKRSQAVLHIEGGNAERTAPADRAD